MTGRLIHLRGIIGADEAGRGPLAGPVLAAAVVLPDDSPHSGLNDSKKLKPDKREALAQWIQQNCEYAIIEKSAAEIDNLNILRASLLAMTEAIEKLGRHDAEVYIDGNQMPPRLNRDRTKLVIKGDGLYMAIAAASILAKTTRDNIMRSMAQIYPEYGFDLHFGYPTPHHLAALERYGPCPIHRRSYGPVQASLEKTIQPQIPHQFELFGLEKPPGL